MAQVARERPTLNKWHHKIQQASLITELDQGQDMRMMQLRDGLRLTRKATAHLAIRCIVAKNDLDSNAPSKGRALPTLVDSAHPAYSNTPHHIIISELPAFQSEHRQPVSFPSCHPTPAQRWE